MVRGAGRIPGPRAEEVDVRTRPEVARHTLDKTVSKGTPKIAQIPLTCEHNRFRKHEAVAPGRPSSPPPEAPGSDQETPMMNTLKDTFAAHRAERAAHR